MHIRLKKNEVGYEIWPFLSRKKLQKLAASCELLVCVLMTWGGCTEDG